MLEDFHDHNNDKLSASFDIEDEILLKAQMAKPTLHPCKECAHTIASKILFMITAVLIGATIFFAFNGASNYKDNFSPPKESKVELAIIKSPCGTSPAEARANGCLFDCISFNWQHPRCHDAELVDTFQALRPWHWYTDYSATTEVTVAEVMTGEYESLYVSWEYHVLHCTFMWQLMHRKALGPLGKLAVDSYIGNMNHTKHCCHVLERSDQPLQKVNTEIRMKFPDCGVE